MRVSFALALGLLVGCQSTSGDRASAPAPDPIRLDDGVDAREAFRAWPGDAQRLLGEDGRAFVERFGPADGPHFAGGFELRAWTRRRRFT